jgi:hypothetical protein
MPLYHFNTVDGGRHRDIEGVELSDDDAARKEGIRFAGSVLAHEPDALWDGRDFRVEVTDHQHTLLFTIITLAVDAPPRPKN